MGVMSTSARVRARRQAVERTAERAAFVREQAGREVDVPEEEVPPAEEDGEPG
jgi:hypothetical protein